jgi:hypothetical protein
MIVDCGVLRPRAIIKSLNTNQENAELQLDASFAMSFFMPTAFSRNQGALHTCTRTVQRIAINIITIAQMSFKLCICHGEKSSLIIFTKNAQGKI